MASLIEIFHFFLVFSLTVPLIGHITLSSSQRLSTQTRNLRPEENHWSTKGKQNFACFRR